MQMVGVLGLLRSLLEIHLVVAGFQCLITEKEMGIICLGCRGYSYKERSRVFLRSLGSRGRRWWARCWWYCHMNDTDTTSNRVSVGLLRVL